MVPTGTMYYWGNEDDVKSVVPPEIIYWVIHPSNKSESTRRTKNLEHKKTLVETKVFI
jgi:hypothetical protein